MGPTETAPTHLVLPVGRVRHAPVDEARGNASRVRGRHRQHRVPCLRRGRQCALRCQRFPQHVEHLQHGSAVQSRRRKEEAGAARGVRKRGVGWVGCGSLNHKGPTQKPPSPGPAVLQGMENERMCICACACVPRPPAPPLPPQAPGARLLCRQRLAVVLVGRRRPWPLRHGPLDRGRRGGAHRAALGVGRLRRRGLQAGQQLGQEELRVRGVQHQLLVGWLVGCSGDGWRLRVVVVVVVSVVVWCCNYTGGDPGGDGTGGAAGAPVPRCLRSGAAAALRSHLRHGAVMMMPCRGEQVTRQQQQHQHY